MAKRFERLSPLIVAALAAVLLAGCAAGKSAPARFYVLTAQAGPAVATTGAGWDALTVGVGPVDVAAYLDRPQIVSRRQDNVLELGEFDRWGEPLDRGIPRVILENLSLYLNSKRLTLTAEDQQPAPDCQVLIRITGFDGTLGGHAQLTARWMLVDSHRQDIVRWDLTTIREPTSGGGYQALVEAQSRALGELCRRIAETLENWRSSR